jgi:hypothetical protein
LCGLPPQGIHAAPAPVIVNMSVAAAHVVFIEESSAPCI